MYEAVHIGTTTVLSQSTCYLIPPGCPSEVAGSSKVESSSAEIPEISYFVTVFNLRFNFYPRSVRLELMGNFPKLA